MWILNESDAWSMVILEPFSYLQMRIKENVNKMFQLNRINNKNLWLYKIKYMIDLNELAQLQTTANKLNEIIWVFYLKSWIIHGSACCTLSREVALCIDTFIYFFAVFAIIRCNYIYSRFLIHLQFQYVYPFFCNETETACDWSSQLELKWNDFVALCARHSK